MILFGIILFQTTTTIQAADSFDINQYQTNANILKNGDVDLTQRITYQFDGNFHGVYYNQDIKGIKGTGEPRVYIDNSKQVTELTNNESDQNNTFKVTRTADAMKIKVYHDVSDQQVTFIYKYRLNGVVTNYLDTAELNWKIIGSGWDNDLSNVKLTVQLPQSNVSQLKAWTHGPLDGKTNVDQKNGRVVMTLDNDPANQFVESHVIFPTEITADNPNVVKKNMKAKIMAQEKQLVLDANAKRKRQQMIYYILMFFGILVIILTYFYKWNQFRKYPGQKHVIPTPLYHIFDEPKFSPSFTKIILDRRDKADSLSLTADLLDEAGKRRMKIEKVGKTYEITALVPPTNAFFKYLIEDIGDGKKVSLKQIKKTSKNDNEHFMNKFDAWSEYAAKGSDKYIDGGNESIVDGFKVSAVITDIILLLMFVVSMIIGTISLLIIGVSLSVLAVAVWGIYWYISKKVTPYTDLGEVEVNKIRAFKRMLKDIDDIKMAEVGDLVLWEQFLPYAVVFGVSDKVIKALKLNFSSEQINQSLVAYYYIGAGSFIGNSNGSFQSAFVSSINAGNSSSVSGGSGGFTGGSSGGFGGGSGGGAF